MPPSLITVDETGQAYSRDRFVILSEAKDIGVVG